MSFRFDVEMTRDCLRAIPASVSAEAASQDAAQTFYIVNQHRRAMAPEHTIVIGARGSGKTEWWRMLHDPRTRPFLVQHRVGIQSNFSVAAGFGPIHSVPGENTFQFPSAAKIRQLAETHEPTVIWQSVLLMSAVHCVIHANDAEAVDRQIDWDDVVATFAADPEQARIVLNNCCDILAKSASEHMIIFDGLDLLATDWQGIRPLVRGLLQACLSWLPLQRLHTKVFIRPDMFDDDDLWTFPDASKLKTARATLTWQSRDLYGLLFNRLGTDTRSGATFRQGCAQRGHPWSQVGDFHLLPKPLARNETAQKRVMLALASPFMGTNPRRGKTYSWLPVHLADTSRQVAPRSWLIALRQAALESEDHSDEIALHWQAIKSGVIEASRIRVDQIAEDYPWVRPLGNALAGCQAPLREAELLSCWKALTQDDLLAVGNKLPPPSLEKGPKGWLADLIDLHVVERLSDGRIQMPDIYRLAFGLGRRGGVKAVK